MPSIADRGRMSMWLAAGVLAVASSNGIAMAQNDWQYPDPYFGILEIEKSHGGPVTRRPRPEVNATSRAKPTFSRPGLFRARRPPSAPRQR